MNRQRERPERESDTSDGLEGGQGVGGRGVELRVHLREEVGVGFGGDEGDGEGVEGDVVVLGGVGVADGEGAGVVEGAGW